MNKADLVIKYFNYFKEHTQTEDNIFDEDALIQNINSRQRRLQFNDTPFINDSTPSIYELRSVVNELKEAIQQMASYIEGGGGSMDDIKKLTQTVSDIDKRLVKTETHVDSIVSTLSRLEAKIDALPSKDYVSKLVTDIYVSIEGTKTLIEGNKTLIEGNKTLIEGTKTLIEKKHSTIIKWVVGTGLVAVGAIFTIMKYFK
ncbi:hypothetical protein [Paenibacillus sp. GbtcB18]|uniref:hypothetical protein n=1 Tax=Paenibacillus sp. GbtcB18 TaxID=2824763 RepID=UPI001C310A16|nr:hypothetical protein [Paenibacillus sp. GbtcB18]